MRLRAIGIIVGLGLCGLLPFGGGCGKTAPQATPEQAMAIGWNQYRLSEYDYAAEAFESALGAAGEDTDLRARALYSLGTVWNLRRPGEDPERARAYYEEVLRIAPENDMAAWSLLALARMQHLAPVGETPDYDRVLGAYQEVMDRFPGHLAAKEAFLYRAAIRIATLEEQPIREAVAELEAFVRQGEGEFIQPAWSLLAIAYTTLDEPDKRLHAEQRSLETTEIDPTNPFNEFAWAYWNIAAVAEFEVGDFDTARTYYNKLIEEYPRDIRVFGARKALERMDRLEAQLLKASGKDSGA